MKAGSTPAAFIASTPRLSCAVIRTYLPVEAECTHRSRDATRNPVSSKCATSALVSCSRAWPVKAASPSSRPRGHRRDRARRDRGAEQLGQCTRGAVLGQELAYIQVDGDRGDVRAVLRRRVHPYRGLPGRHRPAPPLNELMLGHPHPDGRDVEHLPPF